MFTTNLKSFEGRPFVTKELIYSLTTEEEIFERYLTSIKFKNLKNPLRKDNNPSSGFYYNEKGKLRFYDKALSLDEDAIGIVQYLTNLNYPQTLEKIYDDLNLKSKSRIITISPIGENNKYHESCKISFYNRTFNFYDLEYWKKGNITLELLESNTVYAVDKLYKNGSLYYTYNKNDPCYVYIELGSKKAYFPFRKKPRFLSEPHLPVSGLSNLPRVGDYLIITKSKKDELCLKSFGFKAVIGKQSESDVINKDLIVDLYNRFDSIFLLNDYDNAGFINTKKNIFNYPFIKPLFIRDSSKDAFGYCEKYGIEKTQELVNKFKDYVKQFIY